MQTAYYQIPQKSNWQGRKSNPSLAKQYWHQIIETSDIQELRVEDETPAFAILGYACDEGVKRNLGRVGASQGPEAFRERLGKLPLHFRGKRVIDVGDIICEAGDMENAQMLFAQQVNALLSQGIFPIGVGGGHDIAYGHFKGIQRFLKNETKKKVAIINFDAHFDLRPVEDKPNSGTPFYQILSEAKAENRAIDYFALGIQQQSNTQELFEIAQQYDVQYVLNEACEVFDDALKDKLEAFIAVQDYIYITIDLDGFSSAYVTGVSAPSPFGFSPQFVFKVLSFLLKTKKVIALDIAELNPSFDKDSLTASLAAKITDFSLMHL